MIDLDPLPVTGPGTTPGQSPGDSAAFASALDDATTAADAEVADDTTAEVADDAEVDPSAGSPLELAFTAALAPTAPAESAQQPTTGDDITTGNDIVAATADPDLDLASDPDLPVVSDAGSEVASEPSIDQADVLTDQALTTVGASVVAPVAAMVDGSEPVEPIPDTFEPSTAAEVEGPVEATIIAPSVTEPIADPSRQGDAAGDAPTPAAASASPSVPAGQMPVDQAEPTRAAVPTVAAGDAPVLTEAATAEATAPTPAAPRVDAAVPAMNPAAIAESPATRSADAVAAPEMPPAPPPAADLDVPPPAQQLAEALRDVRRMSDGSHRLSLQLHPEELGAVQLEVAVRDGQLHLRAVAETDPTRRLLTASIPELREQLTGAGVSAGSLEVGAESAADHQRADAGDDGTTPDNHSPEGPADQPTDRPTRPIRLDAGQLDIQL